MSEVVVNDVHQVERRFHVRQEVEGLALGPVDGRPLGPSCERLVLPVHEGVEVDNGWLHDFLVREDPPGDCVDVVWLDVGDDFGITVDSLVADVLK